MAQAYREGLLCYRGGTCVRLGEINVPGGQRAARQDSAQSCFTALCLPPLDIQVWGMMPWSGCLGGGQGRRQAHTGPRKQAGFRRGGRGCCTLPPSLASSMGPPGSPCLIFLLLLTLTYYPPPYASYSCSLCHPDGNGSPTKAGIDVSVTAVISRV